MSSHQSQSVGGGPPSAGMQQQGQAPAQTMSQQNLNQIVIEYLVKKGYVKTEQTLRQESSKVDRDGRPMVDRAEDTGTEQYGKAYRLLSDWIKGGLDIYKPELRRLLWPIFVYSFLELVLGGFFSEAQRYLADFGPDHEEAHKDELKIFATITLPVHVKENQITKLYRDNKYRLPLNNHAYYTLVCFLEENGKRGGTVVIRLLQSYFEIIEAERDPINNFGFEAIIERARGKGSEADLEEGIPGAFTGVTNKDMLSNNAVLKLGFMAMEPELATDVRAELEEDDLKKPPANGQRSLVEEFDRQVKREESLDAPNRNELPFPSSRMRDVVMEVQKIKEHRDRFRIESRTGGIGPQLSVCMFTFHNSLDSITCIEFSDDTDLVAVGTQESYIRIWHLHGDPLPSPLDREGQPPSSSRRLIGHSAPVYSVCFSSSIQGPKNPPEPIPSMRPQILLSASSDGTIRLWSLETWTCLVVYRGHDGPVWNVRFGPFGHYFVSCGHDKTARVWAQDHASAVRLLVGHDSSVNQVAWHPNGAYVFSASDQVDKTVRMWSVVTGECVRVFAGHTDFISTLECSPSGKILASADGGGNIILWDIAKGTMIKRCKGHGKGGVWSLSFSVESTCLVSGGADGTVRVWDVELPADPHKNEDLDNIIGTGGQSNAKRLDAGASASQANAATSSGLGGKKKGKDTTITPDQISAFPTKKTPVFKVKFTRMNLVMAAGCYQP